MDELVKWLLTAKGLSVSGILLVIIGSLAKQAWVPGWMYREVVKDRDNLKQSLDIRNQQDQLELDRLAQEAAQMRTQVTQLTEALIQRQERRTRQRSP